MSTITRNYKNLTVVVEGGDEIELFENAARVDEVFGNDTCGKCGNSNIRFVVRTNDDDDKFYELHCGNDDCRAKKTFGCHKKSPTLFPHRKTKEGDYLPDNGWMRWDKEKGCLV
jgi:hypothetical protein